MSRPTNSRRKTWKGKEQRQGDPVMEDPLDTDIVIPIMGPTGVGKSTFINYAFGQIVAPVGHDLKSHTAHMQHYTLALPENPTNRIILVDTPGFDDTFVEDSEILRRIAVWLARSYSDHTKLAGVIYMHDICQSRMLGTPRKNLEMFKKICGNEAIRNVILVTTKWGDINEDVGTAREQQLATMYWREMISQGSRMHRFDATTDSAQEIISLLFDNSGEMQQVPRIDFLHIQTELVDLERILPQTDAAQELRYTLKQLLEAQKVIMEQTKEWKAAGYDYERQWEAEENEKRIRSVILQLQELKIPFSKRLLAFLKP